LYEHIFTIFRCSLIIIKLIKVHISSLMQINVKYNIISYIVLVPLSITHRVVDKQNQ
jgi:hypothetical protein